MSDLKFSWRNPSSVNQTLVMKSFVIAAALALFACLESRVLAAHATKPNILLVFVDDLGWGDFSCFVKGSDR